MVQITRRRWLATTGLPLLAGGLGSYLHVRNPFSAGTAYGHASARELIQRRHLPNVALVTHDGERVRFYDDLVKDKKVIINFIDTRTRECLEATANLAAVQELLGPRAGLDIHTYSITLAPRHDSPAVLRAWARSHGADWTFLTGRPATVETLRKALGFAHADSDAASIQSVLRLGNEPEMRWACCSTLGNPKMIGHMIEADFGPDPTDPAARYTWYCKLSRPAPR